jgi:serine protease Do
VQRYQQLLRRVALSAPGTRVRIEIERSGRPLVLTAQLSRRPSNSTLQPVRLAAIARLGLTVREVDRGTGLVVEDVAPGSVAGRAGIARGDALVESNRHALATARDLEEALQGDGRVSLRVVRGAKARVVDLTVPAAASR